MADFFGDLFDSITGQQATPQQTIIGTNDLLNQAYGTAQGQLGNLGNYNMGLVNATVPSQLAAENLYDPNVANLRSATSKSILDQLNLGGNLSPELQNQVITNALQGNAATGFGVGQGGRGLVARDLGLSSLDLLNQRQNAAQGYVRSSPSLSSLFQPSRGFDPSMIAGDIRGVQAAKDEYANMAEDIRRQNFSALLNTGGKILGTVVGGVFGGAMGAQMGGQIGGHLIQGSRVGGQQQQSQGGGGGGGFMSLLNGLGGGGGGSGGGGYGTGSSSSNDSLLNYTAGSEYA